MVLVVGADDYFSYTVFAFVAAFVVFGRFIDANVVAYNGARVGLFSDYGFA